MKTIILNVEDEYMNEFLNELLKMKKENCGTEECMTINDMTIEEYKKTLKITK